MEKEVLPNGSSDVVQAKPKTGAHEVFTLLKEHFYFPQRIQEMATIEETVATAQDHPYTSIVPFHGAGSKERVTSKELCDLGLHVRQEESGYRITGMRMDSAAAYTDITEGNLIVGVGGRLVQTDMRYSTLHDFKEQVTGTRLSMVSLMIDNDRTIKKFTMPVLSPRQYAESVAAGRDDVKAIRIDRFTAKTYEDIAKILRTFDPRKLRGVVLDLRGNRGGLLKAAVDITSMFAGDKKKVAMEYGRTNSISHVTKKLALFGHLAVDVILDKDSASASEVLTGALRHHRGAAVLGEKSFGKGSVQNSYAIPSMTDKELKITTSHWVTPDNQSIHKTGFVPDIEIPYAHVCPPGDIDDVLEEAVEHLANRLPKWRKHSRRYLNAM